MRHDIQESKTEVKYKEKSKERKIKKQIVRVKVNNLKKKKDESFAKQ